MARVDQITVSSPRSQADWSAAGRLLARYFDWLAPAAGVPSVPDAQPHARAELDDPEGSYGRPGSSLLLARLDSRPVGIVGLRPTDRTDRLELVRFYTDPSARGMGVGRALLDAALDRASAVGATTVVLDTVPSFMPAAVRLYREHGFETAEEPHQLPVADGVRLRRDLHDRFDRTLAAANRG